MRNGLVVLETENRVRREGVQKKGKLKITVFPCKGTAILLSLNYPVQS
jgi:hypothetical protein